MNPIPGKVFAKHPYPEQVVGTFNGFVIEVCLRNDSINTAFHLRYRSYLDVGYIEKSDEELLYDDYDFLPNSRVHLVWYEGRPVATVRGCIYSDKYGWMPTEGVKHFPETIRREIGEQVCILESNRFAVDPEFQGRKSLAAQFLLFRAHGLNAAAQGCSYIITSVRTKHRVFYERYLGMLPLSEESVHVPWANTDVHLVGNTRELCLATILKKGMPDYGPEDIAHYAHCAQLPDENQQIAA